MKFIENHKEAYIDFNSKFIKGSNKYNEEINEIFFSHLIKDNLCKKENITENKYNNKYIIYYCINSNTIKEKIKTFPSLSFTVKNYNLTFILTYKDLFKVFENKIYFMIIFPKNNNIELLHRWLLGEIFISKYTPIFHLEKKSILFYNYTFHEEIKSENQEKYKYIINIKNYFRKIFEVILIIIILICIFLIYRKYSKTRKLMANELEDNNYAYIPKEKYNKIYL